MANSQNAKFMHPLSLEDDQEPYGSILTDEIKQNIKDYETGEIDPWKNIGWAFGCRNVDSEMKVAIALAGTDQWLLQISPARKLTFWEKVCKKPPVADEYDVLKLAETIHHILTKTLRVKKLRWRWDGLPDLDHSPKKPLAAD